MNNTQLKRKYRQLCLHIDEIDLYKTSMEAKKEELELGSYFVTNWGSKTKKVRNDSNFSMNQTSIYRFFQRPSSFHLQPINEGLNSGQSEPPNTQLIDTQQIPTQSEECENFIQPSNIKLKDQALIVHHSYSKELKKDVLSNLEKHEISQTYLIYKRNIPRSTLYDWNQSLSNKSSGTQGRRTLLNHLEAELFDYFLKLRARKLPVSDWTLQTKAKKISKNMLKDPEIELSSKEKAEYEKFEASRGWVTNFKKKISDMQKILYNHLLCCEGRSTGVVERLFC